MRLALLVTECKILLKSRIYWVYVALLVLFYFTQMGSETITRPIEGMENYGYTYSKDPQDIMRKTYQTLQWESEINQFSTYPFGFYKSVILGDDELQRVETILSGLSNDGVSVDASLSFNAFLEDMAAIDDLLGGGSSYEPKTLSQGITVEQTYEEALADYTDILHQDQVTRALARLFADYLGIILGILPAFVVISRILKDKKNDLCSFLYSRGVSSWTIMSCRFLSLILMMLIPLFVISIIPLTQGLYSASIGGVKGDYFAFVKIILGWLLPTLLTVTALSFFLTTLFQNAFALIIQLAWWYGSLFSVSHLHGNVGWLLMPRFNTLGNYELYASIYTQLVYNRLLYTGIGLLLFVGSVLVYSKRREGRWMIRG